MRGSKGYVTLRWKVGTNEYVEAYEHRVVDGAVTLAPVVHHDDEDKGNNQSENLQPMSVEEHGAVHRRVDRAAVLGLYSEGLTQVEVGRRLGIHPATVSKVLRSVWVY